MSLGRIDVADRPVTILARLMREEGEKLLGALAENLEALLGHPVKIQAIDPGDEAVSDRFGGGPVYLFPAQDQQSHPLPSLLALDLQGAVNTGAIFSLAGAEQIEEVLASREIPETLHDSIGEVANVLCGAAVNRLRDHLPEAPDYRRGAQFELVEAPAWPGLLAQVDASSAWDLVAGRILVDGEEKGTLLLASSSGREEGMISPEQIAAAGGNSAEVETPRQQNSDTPEDSGEESAPADEARAATEGAAAEGAERAGGETQTARENGPEGQGAAREASEAAPTAKAGQNPPGQGLFVQLAAHGADAGALDLRNLLEECGVTVAPAQANGGQCDALFVVSRSPTDMAIRLESFARPPRRPGLVIACSDRPTRDMVVAARSAGVDAFLVLPTTRDKLTDLLAKLPAPATA